jgi:hypothetical protein
VAQSLITPCLKIVVVDAVQALLARNPDKMRACGSA